MIRRTQIVFTFLSISLFARLGLGASGLEQVDRVYDYGVVGIGYDVFHDFRVVNRDTLPVRIDSAVVKCDCSSVWITDSVIAPGDTGLIHLKFNTRDYYGRISKAVQVYTSSRRSPHLEFFYLTTVGQYLMGLKPSPTSIFFLPKKGPATVTISNPALDEVTIEAVEPFDNLVEVELLDPRADKGKSLKLRVVPRNGLAPGTYQTNFRLTLKLPTGYEEPLYLSMPVKIVVY